MSETSTKTYMDLKSQQGNKWLILTVVTAVSMIDVGLAFTFGALFPTIMKQFRTDRATAATVQSLLLGITLSFGVVSGGLITKLGFPKVSLMASIMVPVGLSMSFFATSIVFLYISIGIMTGIGTSIIYISSIATMGKVFSGRQHILCLTSLLASHAVAALIYPYFLLWIVSQYGLFGTFLILGGMTSNSFLLPIIYWTNRAAFETGTHIDQDFQYGETDARVNKPVCGAIRTLCRNTKDLMTRPYICVLFATGTSLSTLFAYIGLILDIDKWKGYDDYGALSFIILNSVAIVSRLVPGLLKQLKGINILMYPIIATIFGCIGQFLLYFAKQHAVYLVGTALNGVTFGGIVASAMSAVVKIVQPNQVPVATGLQTTITGLTTTAIGPLFGSVRDKSGSYGNVLITVGIAQGIAATLYILALICRRRI